MATTTTIRATVRQNTMKTMKLVTSTTTRTLVHISSPNSYAHLRTQEKRFKVKKVAVIYEQTTAGTHKNKAKG